MTATVCQFKSTPNIFSINLEVALQQHTGHTKGFSEFLYATFFSEYFYATLIIELKQCKRFTDKPKLQFYLTL